MRVAPVTFRALLFFAASNAAVLFVLKFGLFLWPERLPANSQNIFWLASGVNVAGLLILGLRYWPVLLLNAFPAWWFAGEPLTLTALGSLTNAMEALLAAWAIRKFGAFQGRFDTVRAVGALLVASVVAPFVNTIVIPAYFCAKGLLPWENYGKALANWNLSNGAAMLLLAPLLIALWRGNWNVTGRKKEFLVLSVAAVVLCSVAFHSVFEGAATNFAFIAFPVVIFAAARFGTPETSAVLLLMLVALYGSLVVHARAQPPLQMSATIWFVQAFCWVLSATGLLVAAMGAERRRAENRSLEASLREDRARLAALRYQINPHFLFNAMNSIRAAMPLSTPVPREMITDLSNYLRSTLTHDETDIIPLRDELSAASDYLAIERHRFGDALRVSLDIPPEANNAPVPIFILQPLVENAIRHGFETSRDPFHLKISVVLQESRLILEVANTGAWKPPGDGTGLGLENIRRRLETLYPDDFTFDHSVGDGWVRVTINLPFRSTLT